MNENADNDQWGLDHLLPALNIDEQIDPNGPDVAVDHILHRAVRVAIRFDPERCLPPLRLVTAEGVRRFLQQTKSIVW